MAYFLRVMMSSKWRRQVAVFFAITLLCLSVTSPSYAYKSLIEGDNEYGYDFVPYSDPLCGCDPESDFPISGGCCIAAGMIMGEIFTGGGVWPVMWPNDSLQGDFYMDTLYLTPGDPDAEDIGHYLRKMSATWRNMVIEHSILTGSSFDAANLLNAMRNIQKSNVQTLRDYHPAEQLCRFGTLSRSVSSSQQKGNIATVGIATQAIQRQMLRTEMSTGESKQAGESIGESADVKNRWKQYTTMFCDKDDFNEKPDKHLTNPYCKNGGDLLLNRDIDYTRSVDAPFTLDIDYSKSAGAGTNDTKALMALQSNLYASRVVTNLTGADLHAIATEGFGEGATQTALRKFFDYRSIVAKRSVAENSFAAIAGMKASGDTSSRKYIVEVMKRLGLHDGTGGTPDDITRLLGKNPSYYAQMNVLTKHIYQDPGFVMNLMDGPANVERSTAAMEGIEIAQDRDIYESLRRSEMLLSTLLEVYVQKQQDKFVDKGRAN